MITQDVEFLHFWLVDIDGVRVVGVAFQNDECDGADLRAWFKFFVPGYSIMELQRDWHARLVALEDFLGREYFQPLYGTAWIQLPTQFLPEGVVFDLETGGKND